ncbi:MAG: hypothetical protein QW678_00980 [Candidatus Aenigmatarchaeota archaeon]
MYNSSFNLNNKLKSIKNEFYKDLRKIKIDGFSNIKEVSDICFQTTKIAKDFIKSFHKNTIVFPGAVKPIYNFLKYSWILNLLAFKSKYIKNFEHIRSNIILYCILMKYYNKNSFHELLKHLENKSKRKIREFKFPIPRYVQHYNSCGVVCMLNAIKVYLPFIKLNKNLEKELLSRVIYKDYPGNLAPLIAKTSKEIFGIEAKVFIDMKSYLSKIDEIKNFTKTFYSGNISEIITFFLEKIKEIEYEEREKFTFNEIKKLINNGCMISFVKEVNETLHYNLIFGYKNNKILVFDPLGFTYEVSKNEINNTIRNRISLWGCIFYSPLKKILEKMNKTTKKIATLVKNLENINLNNFSQNL